MTSSHSDNGLSGVRAGVLRQPGLVGEPLRDALTSGYDHWLAELCAPLASKSNVALVAVGGLGRRDLAPYSDLDLVLLYEGKLADVAALADGIWYPIWDSGVSLDHSVRTVDQAVGVARDDLKALLGLLDMRHIAGDPGLAGTLRERVLEFWRANVHKRADELHELSKQRWQISGDAAFLLEPNLKDSRGGLRDAQSLRALALAQVVDYPADVRAAQSTLLDVRGELQRLTQQDNDILRQQEQPTIAKALGGDDSDMVLRMVNESARTIDRALDRAWRRVVAQRPPSLVTSARRLLRGPFSVAPEREPLAKDLVSQGGEVVLARDADPWADPLLILRAARASAENDLPLAPFALERLASESAPLPRPWPKAALDDFVSVLSAGRRGVAVLEALDQAGLLTGLIPEWDAVRFRAQHNPVHRYTVDRHLTETASQASMLTQRVSRPDLLLLGALLHDIGKGFPGGDHSEVGAVIAERIANRMGLSYGDSATVTALVRHHLLLPNTATRRDLEDPVTVATVAEAVSGSGELLDLLHALTISDALATGPAVWGDWKSGLVNDLVARTHAMLGGATQRLEHVLDDRGTKLATAGVLAVQVLDEEVLVAAPDSLGVLSKAAGVLALHSLDVRSASIHTQDGMAVNTFVVVPRFGSVPEAAIVRGDLARALEGTLGLADRLSAKERAYRRRDDSADEPPRIYWFDDAATDATVLEIRTRDAIGLLYRVTSTLERFGVDIRSARLSSLGGAVVDAFYVTDPDGNRIAEANRRPIEEALLSV
ncbi:UTP--GlnB (protein PII) uridylyltransferase GlnD [Jatrophihabitans sp. GAS493]|uniref:[protein-PII] uridylyltransferase n=1 Tax=Jatrophihabitans sp. GAS493 TaxID=1907575 RepID=UPI000BC0A95B|nr:[protein-PII] uridylyltransferase [Jatrophihabitans sp. GAS493]SOD73442.1 UTP--GlnB (protein PII) uridylyltransferase GlnD [Jatrophihabitans sp. GAS493]